VSPAFCLLHGKWHDPTCWDPLVPKLEARGHRALTPAVPFHDPAAGHEERAAPAVEELRSAGERTVVVGHSLAAAVAPLVALHGEASLLVYLCPAPVGPFGGVDAGVAPFRPGFPFPPDREDGTSVWEPDAAIAAMYPRLPAATARALAARLRPGTSMPDPYPIAGHPDVPAAFVLARHDEFFVADWSRAAARAVVGTEAVEIDSGHFPMIEAQDALASVLERFAGDTD
jgi:pimeloyl-ACP methyl ester carboxylesterase